MGTLRSGAGPYLSQEEALKLFQRDEDKKIISHKYFKGGKLRESDYVHGSQMVSRSTYRLPSKYQIQKLQLSNNLEALADEMKIASQF